MNAKERLLCAIKGQETDRIPWSPFLAYYWDYLSKEIQAAGQIDYMEQMGADPLLRGFHTPFRIQYQNCEISQSESNGKRCTRYETPVGSLQEIETFSPAGNTWFLTGHAVRSQEDLQVFQYIVEHCQVIEDTALLEEDWRKYRDRALLLPVIGLFSKTSFQSMLERWIGTEGLVYAVYDYPKALEECLEVMEEKNFQTVQIAAKTSPEGFIFWEDSSTTNLSPQLFLEYTAPEIRKWGEYLHKNGKLLIHHACGHLKNLLPFMGQLPVDMIESISPPPTGNIQLWEAQKLLPEQIGLIGGIEPTVFQSSTAEELENYVKTLLSQVNPSRFILANSDSCPPDVSYDKFLLVSRMVREWSCKN